MSTLNNDPRCAFTTRRQLFAVLARMRDWYREGLSDRDISEAIAAVLSNHYARRHK